MTNTYLPPGISRKKQLLNQPRESRIGNALSSAAGSFAATHDPKKLGLSEEESLLELLNSPLTNAAAERSLLKMKAPWSLSGDINFFGKR
jgi:hypothetical protein